jgi:hypothetical protein
MTGSPPHGTRARYQQERRAGLVPCAPCTYANADACRRQRSRGRELYPIIRLLAGLLEDDWTEVDRMARKTGQTLWVSGPVHQGVMQLCGVLSEELNRAVSVSEALEVLFEKAGAPIVSRGRTLPRVIEVEGENDGDSSDTASARQRRR